MPITHRLGSAILLFCVCLAIALIAIWKGSGLVYAPYAIETEYLVQTTIVVLALGQYPIHSAIVLFGCLLLQAGMAYCPPQANLAANMLAAFFTNIAENVLTFYKMVIKSSLVWLGRHALVVAIAILMLTIVNFIVDKRAQSTLQATKRKKEVEAFNLAVAAKAQKELTATAVLAAVAVANSHKL